MSPMLPRLPSAFLILAAGLSLAHGLPSRDALLSLVAIVGPVLVYFAARYTARAPLQTALNDAFRSLTEELQVERARYIVRISELEAEVLRQRGEIAAKIQLTESLVHLLQRSGVTLPDHLAYLASPAGE